MIEAIKFITSKIFKRQGLLLVFSTLSPLFLSGILYYTSSAFGIDFLHKQMKLYLIGMWLLTMIVFSGLFLMFVVHANGDGKYKENKRQISFSIRNLLKNRLGNEDKNRNNLGIFLSIIIIMYYVLTLTPYIIEYYNDTAFSAIWWLIGPLCVLVIFTLRVKNIFIGLREKTINRYLGIVSFLSVWLIFLWLNFSSKIKIASTEGADLVQILMENANWFIPVIITSIIAVIIFLSETKLRKTYPKRTIYKWEKSMKIFDLVTEMVFSFVFLILLILLVLFMGIISISGSSNVQQSFLIIIIFMIASIFLMGYTYLKNYAASFIENMIKWYEFFKCYNGKSTGISKKDYGRLIKLTGKCEAISINDKYRKKFDDYNQHFLIDINGEDKLIDVISLEEKTPLGDYYPIVRENNELVIIGELKSILDDEAVFKENNRVSRLIIAHHIELKNSQINNSH